MKIKILSLIIVFLFSICCYSWLHKNNSKLVFNEESDISNGYRNYDITFNDYLSFDNYRKIFDGISNNDYVILDIEIDNDYNAIIKEDINNIMVSRNNYLVFLDNYIDMYIEVLKKHQLDSEIAKIYSQDLRIKRLNLICTINIYNLLINSASKY
ncbi:MAG: hypothetical protein Q4G04_00760 [bacterium]|nr:hypothetical protein [bacterium]